MAQSRKNNSSKPTRDRILDAAERLFIQKGFADTSMSKIAADAKITKSLIHHHFGSKEQLWQEVKHRRMASYLEFQRSQLLMADADVKCLEESLQGFFMVLKAAPQVVRLIGWHMIDRDMAAMDEEEELFVMGIEKIVEAQEKGEIRKDVDPRLMLIAAFSLALHWFMGKHVYLKWVGAVPEPESIDQEYLDTMLKIFFEGILPR